MAYKVPAQDSGIELMVQEISQRIDSLKVEFNLYFSGEIRVPPEKERVMLEKKIRNLMYSGKKTARLNLLIQNASSKFSLYNNMWLKRMNEIETGVSKIQLKKVALMQQGKEKPKAKPKVKPTNIDVSLNNEDSFDSFFDKYTSLVGKKSKKKPDKEKVINSIKTKMMLGNVIDAKVSLSVEKGKLKIKIKSQY